MVFSDTLSYYSAFVLLQPLSHLLTNLLLVPFLSRVAPNLLSQRTFFLFPLAPLRLLPHPIPLLVPHKER